jgi:invasion protein IalB
MSIVECDAARWLAAAALLTLATTAAAQQPAPKPAAPKAAPSHNAQAPAAPAPAAPAVSTQPSQQSSTATYGDWAVVCEVQAGPPAHKSCYMDQAAQLQGQTISRVLIPLQTKGEPVRLFVQVPVNVSFAAAVRIVADAKDSKDPGVAALFRRCVPAGCFAEVELKEDQQSRFRAATEAGKLTYRDAADREVSVPVSFKGFAQAYEALLKQ